MSASVETAPIGAPTVSTLLRRCWQRHAAKHAARAAGTSPDTARAWVAGLKSPSADVLLRMARHNDLLRAELVRLLTNEDEHEVDQGVLPVARGTADAARHHAGEAREVVAPHGRPDVTA